MASRLDFSQIRSLYVGTSSSTQVDTNNLIVAGNVGIGTDSPGAKLHNYSTATSNVFISGYGTAAQNDWGGEHAFFVNANNGIIIGKANAQNDTNRLYTFYNDAAGNAEQYIYNTSNTATIKLDSAGDTYFNGGNVGIGTTAPDFKLDVNGDVRLGTSLLFSGTNSYPRLGRSTNDLTFQTDASAEVMRITNAGNVGIGTDSPTVQLQVNGNFRLYTTNNDSNELRGAFNVGGTADPLQFSMYKADATTVGTFLTADGASYFVGGNVGIGTTNPLARLNVWTPSATGQQVGLRLNNPFGFDNLNTGAKIVFSQDRSTAEDIPMGELGVGQGDAATSVNGYMYFSTKGSNTMGERMRITAGGNVLINTTTDSGYKLDVVGQSRFGSGSKAIVGTDGTYSSYSTIGFGGTTNGYNRVFGFDGTSDGLYLAAATGHGIYFRVNGSGSDSMFINSSGNVGIGTTAPVTKLHVAGAGNVTGGNIHMGDNTDATGKWTYLTGAHYNGATNPTGISIIGSYSDASQNSVIIGGSIYEANPATNIQFWTHTATTHNLGGSERMRITSAGNVGIGTTSVSNFFTVVTNLGGSPANLSELEPYSTVKIKARSDRDNILYIAAKDALTGMLLQSGTTSTAADLLLNPFGGNVGIGTTSPGEKLSIGDTGNVGMSITDGTHTQYVASIATANAYGNGSTVGQLYLRGYDGIGFSGNQGGATHMTLLTGGNVGIGTTSPVVKTHIVGPTLSTSSETTYPLWLSDTGDTTKALILGFDLVDDVGVIQAVDQAVAWKNISISPIAGNVGIGTTAPNSKLSVNGGDFEFNRGTGALGNKYFIINKGASNDGGFILRRDNANDWQIVNQAGNGNLVFYSYGAASEVLTILRSNGNVGIGTTAPVTPLQVASASNAVDVLRIGNTAGDLGSVQGVTHLAINHFNAGTNPSTRITAYQDSTSGWPGGMYFSTRSLNTDSAPLERMRITSAGNIGIGTTSPQYLLDVNGDAQINAQGTGPAYAYVPDGEFGLDSLLTSGSENVALGKPDVWLRIHVDGVAFVFPGYQES
jgi:hypothetical protein